MSTDKKPIVMLLHCPSCGKKHADEGEWATREHKTHRCVQDGWGKGCGHEWALEDAVFGATPADCEHTGIPEIPLSKVFFMDSTQDQIGAYSRTTPAPGAFRVLDQFEFKVETVHEQKCKAAAAMPEWDGKIQYLDGGVKFYVAQTEEELSMTRILVKCDVIVDTTAGVDRICGSDSVMLNEGVHLCLEHVHKYYAEGLLSQANKELWERLEAMDAAARVDEKQRTGSERD